MLDLEPEADMKFVGYPLAMAMGRVALVAEQAQRPVRSRDGGFCQCGQLIEFMLRLRRLQVTLENPQHLGGMTAASRQSPFFRGAKLLQMYVADAPLIESGSELPFRESRPSRRRDGADIDHESDPRLRERLKKGACGGVLVADGEQPSHDLISISSDVC